MIEEIFWLTSTVSCAIPDTSSSHCRGMTRRHPSRYEHSRKYSGTPRALRNMIRTGLVVETDLNAVAAVCRPAACAPTGFSG